MRKKLLTLYFVFFVVLELCYAQTDTSLNWKFAFLSETDGVFKPIDSDKIIPLPQESNFKIYICADNICYCYVIYEDPEGLTSSLFSGVLGKDSNTYLPNDSISAYSITPPSGTEKIHIIISQKQQKELESLISKCSTSEGSIKVVEKILLLKKTVSSFTSEPIKPATTGGTTRSLSNDQEIDYTLFTGTDVYVKTIRIKH